MVVWLVGCLVGCFIACLFASCLAGWLAGWLVAWLPGWLLGWLARFTWGNENQLLRELVRFSVCMYVCKHVFWMGLPRIHDLYVTRVWVRIFLRALMQRLSLLDHGTQIASFCLAICVAIFAISASQIRLRWRCRAECRHVGCKIHQKPGVQASFYHTSLHVAEALWPWANFSSWPTARLFKIGSDTSQHRLLGHRYVCLRCVWTCELAQPSHMLFCCRRHLPTTQYHMYHDGTKPRASCWHNASG